MAFIHLRSEEVKNNKERKIKLSNFLRNHKVNVLFPQLPHIVRYNESELQQKLIETLNNEEHVRQYLLSTSDFRAPPFQPPQQGTVLTPKETRQWSAEATIGEQVFAKKIRDDIAKIFSDFSG